MNPSSLTPQELAHPGCTEKMLGIDFDAIGPDEFQNLMLESSKDEVSFVLEIGKRVLRESSPREGTGSGEWIGATHAYKRGNSILALLSISLPPPQLNIPPQIYLLLPDGERVSIPAQYDHANFSPEKIQERAELVLKERRII